MNDEITQAEKAYNAGLRQGVQFGILLECARAFASDETINPEVRASAAKREAEIREAIAKAML